MVKIEYKGGIRFAASTRGHEIVVDLPPAKGGTDEGMTPPELLVASFGACIGVYVTGYLNQVGLNAEGTTIEVNYETAEDPLRIAQLHAKVTIPGGIPRERRAAVQRVAEKCLIHQTLCFTPAVTIDLV